ncbi:chromate resistance protein ChrB domain-containing protein [Nocardia tengchongensis]|uniref:chromate resistance protein ChrB domain-containing protein n=1 Tax=Nocardia tengchongensis TaxID=2055889 RepID=UPI00364CB1EC
MRGVDLSHYDGNCSFETILRHYDLDDSVLWELAPIVYEADLDEERYNTPEAPGLDTVPHGLSMICTDQPSMASTNFTTTSRRELKAVLVTLRLGLE